VHEGEAILELRLPELFAPFDQVVPTPNVVDEDVELTHLLEQARDLFRVRVIGANGDAAASARGHDLGGLVDGLRAVLHPGAAPHAPPGAVHRGARLPEGGRDAATGAPRCPRDHRYLSRKGFAHGEAEHETDPG